MSTDKRVVVYGASGYTGRLICEYLREYGIPFLAAGRDHARVKAAVDAVPGIDTVEYEIAEVEHTTEALAEAFRGAAIVLNTVGPFARYGHEVVRACLEIGAHYTDTNGEQNWMIDVADRYGTEFDSRGILLTPGLAQMYSLGEIAANICLENPGLDTLDIEVFWKGYPTVVSTNTILTNAAFAKAYYLEQNQYVAWPADGGVASVVVPGRHDLGLALPWGGTSHPVWFKNDPRVANVRAQGGVLDRALMQGVPLLVAAALEQMEGKSEAEKYEIIDAQSAAIRSEMPPRENPRINTSLDSVHASGPLGRAHCAIHGNCNYKQTALLNAHAAAELIQAPPRRTGFASSCQAFGHRELLGTLRAFGLVLDPIVTVHG
ncbi:MAG: saccharopine dehydrogenase NADP-binding domain-containing protein [Nocardia sp.]|nr:saccharopine dehydrogenase NADP-binding domain-containing protein [Nocardia sp.]